MSAVSMKLLLESGVHFGHQTNKWNPKMKPFIFGFQRLVWCPKCTPDSSKSFMDTADMTKSPFLRFIHHPPHPAGQLSKKSHAPVRQRVCVFGADE